MKKSGRYLISFVDFDKVTLLSELCFPKTPQDKTYTGLVELVEKHLELAEQGAKLITAGSSGQESSDIHNVSERHVSIKCLCCRKMGRVKPQSKFKKEECFQCHKCIWQVFVKKTVTKLSKSRRFMKLQMMKNCLLCKLVKYNE